jgi:DNA modification methylase
MNIQQTPIKSITPYAKNPRKNEAAVDKVAASIKEFGFQQPIVVDKDGVIIAGHTRYKAALKLGLIEVPVLYAVDLTDAQVKAYRLADNKTNEFAEWDMDLLVGELGELKEFNFDMQPFGFETEAAEVVEDDFDLDTALQDIVEPITKRGDIWQLGRHRVMCGDATIQTDVNHLMDGLLADMTFTDPPYNVDYVGKTKDSLKIENDKMANDKFYQFLYDAYMSMYGAVKSGGAIYVCHADTEGINFRQAMKDAGWELKQCIIWVKNALVMGRQDHHWQHEPILYGWKPGETHRWYGGRNKTTVIKSEDGVFINKIKTGFQLTFNNGHQKVVMNVPEYEVKEILTDEITTTWHIDKPIRSGEHPTMKPIKLCARAIKNSSKDGDTVLDLFGGSGSTLIACEQIGRSCYMSELDPKYCDVIINRWEQFTGQKAVRINEGQEALSVSDCREHK